MKNYSYGYLFKGIRKSDPSTIYFFREVWYQYNPTVEELDADLNDFLFEESAVYNYENGTNIKDFTGVIEIIKEDNND